MGACINFLLGIRRLCENLRKEGKRGFMLKKIILQCRKLYHPLTLTLSPLGRRIDKGFILILSILFISKCDFVLAEDRLLFNPYLVEGLHYVWSGYDGSDMEIYYSYWDGKKWGKVQQITDNPTNDFSPALALDQDGNSWLVWAGEDGVGTSIYCSYWNGKRWSEIKQVSDINIYEDTLPVIAFDNKNTPFIVWCGNDGVDDDIYLSSWTGNRWSSPKMVNTDDATPDITPAVCFDKQDRLLVVWCGYGGDNYQLYFSQKIDKNWTGEEPVFTESFSANFPTLLKGKDTQIELLLSQKGRQYKTLWNGEKWSCSESIQIFLQREFLELLNIDPVGPGYIAWITGGISQGMKIFHPGRIIKKQRLIVKRTNKISSFIEWLREEIDSSAIAEVEPNKYIAFGDSITEGYGAETEGYPSRLERKLNENIAPSTVINEGVGGETTNQGLERMDGVLSADNAQFLLLMEGANDVMHGFSTETIIFNLGVMADKCRSFGTTPLLASLTPRLDGLATHVENDVNPAIVELAKQKEITYVDQYTEMNASKEDYMADHVHPNDAGYELMSNIWFNAINGILNPPHEDNDSGCGIVPLVYPDKTAGGLYKNLIYLIGVIFFVLIYRRRVYQ